MGFWALGLFNGKVTDLSLIYISNIIAIGITCH